MAAGNFTLTMAAQRGRHAHWTGQLAGNTQQGMIATWITPATLPVQGCIVRSISGWTTTTATITPALDDGAWVQLRGSANQEYGPRIIVPVHNILLIDTATNAEESGFTIHNPFHDQRIYAADRIIVGYPPIDASGAPTADVNLAVLLEMPS